MELQYKKGVEEEAEYFEKTGNLKLIKKINRLLDELKKHPKTGTGKPEKLKENLSGFWSRRINKEHRIVYKIDTKQKIVKIYSMYGHYDDIDIDD